MSTASASTSKPAFLLVGLPLNMGPTGPIKVPWSDVPISIAQEAKDVTKILKERGYDTFEIIGTKPNEVRQTVEPKLRSRHWDALVVGGGIKGIPEMTGALEDLVNTTFEVSPSTRVMFLSKGPMSMLEVVERFEGRQAGKS